MDLIAEWRSKGLLGPTQAELLADLEGGRLVSLSSELRALLYAGVLLVVLGFGKTLNEHFLRLWPLAVGGALVAVIVACGAYCFSRGAPFANEEVLSPTPAFDYVLYFGCAAWGLLWGYLENVLQLLGDRWSYYLLFSAALFFVLAYRFDNRLVLATAIGTLGGWFGWEVSQLGMPFFRAQSAGLAYGATVLVLGAVLTEWVEFKRHFRDVFYNAGLHVLAGSLLWSVVDSKGATAYLLALLVLSATAGGYGLRRRSFQYFLYGTVYAYVGLSSFLLIQGYVDDALEGALYFLVSSVALAVLIFKLRPRLEQHR